jgi:hypothetical protein
LFKKGSSTTFLSKFFLRNRLAGGHFSEFLLSEGPSDAFRSSFFLTHTPSEQQAAEIARADAEADRMDSPDLQDVASWIKHH